MDLDDILHISDNSNIKIPKRGSLMIAEPLLKEQFFDRAVILIMDIDKEDGVMGLALNKRTDITLNDIIPDWDAGNKIPIYCGGPVDTTRLFMIHTLPDIFEGAIKICPGLYVGGSVEDIVSYINDGGVIEGKVRFFLGYSGWTGKQIIDEISHNVWAVNNLPEDFEESILRGSDNPFWRREVERLGHKYRSWLVIPQNPTLN
ncbi:MAG: YqgE/AlgH family protein [Prevotella sp.]|nr:YqgE/AlgH family protein [Bacteroides sp.]MCM1365646.1 YqgE/AlgH family protein [Prevotella sp.]